MSVRTGSKVLPCRKRCKYSRPDSHEPSGHVENNSSFVDIEKRTRDTAHKSLPRKDSCRRLNESEIQEALQEIKSEVCSSNFMFSNALKEFKENEILKTLWEMKAEHGNFQKEVLTHLLSIETEINNLKNVLCLSRLPETHRTISPGTTAEGKTKPSIIYIQPPCETETNYMKNSLCICKHPETQIVQVSTKSSITETSSETEVKNVDNALCMCKHPETQIVRESMKPSVTETPSETEINNVDNAVYMCIHPETQIERRSTMSSITETPCETEVNNIDNGLCICRHPETQIVRASTTETPSKSRLNNVDNALCISKHPVTKIVGVSIESSTTETPRETKIKNIDNALCACKHHETHIENEGTKPSIIEPSSETAINQSDNYLCMDRHSEASITDDIIRLNTEIFVEVDENETKDMLSVYSHPRALNTSVTRSGLPKLPIDSMESLQNVEEWLEDKDNVQILTHHFCTVGGDHAKNTTRRLLTRSFTQNMAVSINWTGKNQKYPLSKGCLVKVIIAAVKLTHKNENITEKTVEEFIKSWFRCAKDRGGGREKRRRASNFLLKGIIL